MSNNGAETMLRQVLVTLLSEALYGPRGDAFFLNSGDRGLVASLDALSAETASARPGGRSSVASHVEHLRYGLELLNREARGERRLRTGPMPGRIRPSPRISGGSSEPILPRRRRRGSKS